MTAEITIMNKSAIVLAADSAVTIGQARIYNSANKIFTLSKYHPVGIMIYQGADFMGIPWESIIKLYRKQLGRKEFAALGDYVNDFISYIESDRTIFPEDFQIQSFKNWANGILFAIRNDIRKAVEIALADKPKPNEGLTEKEIEKIVEDLINKTSKARATDEVLEHFKSCDFKSILEKYSPILDELIKNIYQDVPLKDLDRAKLKEVLTKYSYTNFFCNFTGIVIAGFGKNDVLPSYFHFKAELVFENKLKHSKPDNQALAKGGNHLEFFAQSEKGWGFLTGIDGGLLEHASKKMNEMKTVIENSVYESLLKSPEKELEIRETLKGLIDQAEKEYTSSVSEFIQQKSINRIVNTISTLPKDELAAVAEALVNLTSFKKRVSGEPETVGGPIDVAVISKGDGFIWIKRKHYFDSRLNHHFLNNYFMEKENERE